MFLELDQNKVLHDFTAEFSNNVTFVHFFQLKDLFTKSIFLKAYQKNKKHADPVFQKYLSYVVELHLIDDPNKLSIFNNLITKSEQDNIRKNIISESEIREKRSQLVHEILNNASDKWNEWIVLIDRQKKMFWASQVSDLKSVKDTYIDSFAVSLWNEEKELLERISSTVDMNQRLGNQYSYFKLDDSVFIIRNEDLHAIVLPESKAEQITSVKKLFTDYKSERLPKMIAENNYTHFKFDRDKVWHDCVYWHWEH